MEVKKTEAINNFCENVVERQKVLKQYFERAILIDMEKVEILFENEKVRIERIESFGEASPKGFFYDQDEGEWVTLLNGSAELEVEGKPLSLKKGEHYFLKAHTLHRVEQTSEDCVWLCVFVKEEGKTKGISE